MAFYLWLGVLFYSLILSHHILFYLYSIFIFVHLVNLLSRLFWPGPQRTTPVRRQANDSNVNKVYSL
jgi:hypothetical protein